MAKVTCPQIKVFHWSRTKETDLKDSPPFDSSLEERGSEPNLLDYMGSPKRREMGGLGSPAGSSKTIPWRRGLVPSSHI